MQININLFNNYYNLIKIRGKIKTLFLKSIKKKKILDNDIINQQE